MTPPTPITPPPALRFEIAARAAARMETLDYPDNPKGRARADAFVEANWRAIWELWVGI